MLTEKDKQRMREQAYNNGRDLARIYLRREALRSPSPIPPTKPGCDFPIWTDYSAPPNHAGQLTKLRDSCLTLFDKKPLKRIPPICIEEDAHFDDPTTRAHYHPTQNRICFRNGYLDKGTPQQWVNTMKHELLHAWIDQHDFRGDRAHDDLFKAAAELLGIEWWEGYRES